MLIGILSDTHDRAAAAKAAVRLLRERGAEYFIHCGDVGGREVLAELAGLPAAFVWGNNDWDRTTLGKYADDIGLQCCGTRGELDLGAKRFVVIHGDDTPLKRRLLELQEFDYLLQGHTHVPHEERVGRTRVINPGALYRANPRTVALLDTTTDHVKWLELAGQL